MIHARSLELSDLPKIEEVHRAFYPNLELPDFSKGICSFVIENDIGNQPPICFGTVQRFAEIIILTDKSKTPRQKRDALYKVLSVSSYVAGQSGFKELHAFTNDEKYAQVLLKRGFARVTQNALVIDI